MNTKALRQKILDLAIHGKLVPQDPNDEPASVLLERIRAEKERLIKEGKIKKPKKSKAACDKPHYPFELTKGWEWCRLEDIAYVASGSTPEKAAFVSEGIPYIKMYNLRNQEIDFDFKPQYIKEEVHNGKLQRSRTEVGDLIMNIVGPPLGKLALIPKSLPQANFNQAAVLIRPYLHKEIINVYLKAYLEEMSEINSISTKGTAGQVNISLTQSQNMRIPLPPLQEQIRINNELRVWLTYVQQIENGRETLNLAIKQAKGKILDLAIHGKLVPQDPNDEPASELLKRINPKAEITCDNPQYGKLPKGWCETTLGNTIVVKSGDAIKVRDNRIGKYPIYGGNGITGYNESYNVDGINIIIGRVGFYCGSVHYVNNKIWVTDNAFVTKIMGNVYTPKFLYYLLLQYDLKQYSNSTAQPVISGKTVYPINVMLPPLSEQHRIVAKIEEQFAQLDKIESSL